MPVYAYSGLNGQGRPVRGIVNAESARAARQKLRRQGIFPTRVDEERAGPAASSLSWTLPRRLPTRQLATMSRQLATLVAAGLPLAESLGALSEQVENESLRRALSQVRDKVIEGRSLADAMAEHPRMFSPLYVNMVRAGEASGALDVVLGRLADYAENQARLINRVRAAMTYPAIMVLIGGTILFFLVAYVVPRITQMFVESRHELPLPTVMLIAASNFLARYWWVLALFIGATAILLRRALATEAGRARFDSLLIRIPYFGGLVKKVMIARFSRTLATLLASGIPLLQALAIVRNVIGNTVIARAVDEGAEAIREGQSIAPPLARSGIFPPMVLHMIGVGEQSGELETMLTKAADAYDDEVEAAATALTALMEPIMVVIMGAVVLFIVLAILMPIFELNRLVR